MTLSDRQQRCLYGACVMPGAFEAVQLAPWNLSPYQAARLVHYAVSRRRLECAPDAVFAFREYVETYCGELPVGPEYACALNLCKRANILDATKQKVVLWLAAWMPDPAMLLDMMAPTPPSQHVRRAFEAEMCVVKKVVWKRPAAPDVDAI
jgi:hypothetical protein